MIKAQKELKEEHSNAEKIREEANTRIPDDDTYASRDDDIKVQVSHLLEIWSS